MFIVINNLDKLYFNKLIRCNLYFNSSYALPIFVIKELTECTGTQFYFNIIVIFYALVMLIGPKMLYGS